MRLLCDAELTKDGRGWVCTDPDTEDFGGPWELRWRSAWRGRFVAHSDEWIVSLFRACQGRYCPGQTHVVRKVRGKWVAAHELEIDAGIGDDCLVLRGSRLDRLVCLDAVGPHQGFMSERLAVHSFAGGEVATQALMEKEQGGECFLQPPQAEYHEDELTLLPAGDSGAALTARLRVRRAPCDPKTDDGHGPPTVKAEHVLRFVARGGEVIPDEASAALIRRHGWEPGSGR